MQTYAFRALLIASLLAMAAMTLVGPAFAQTKPPLARTSELIFGWNDDQLDGWGGSPGPVLNKDQKFLTEGAGSASVDWTGQPTWASGAFVLNFPEPQDWSKYGFITVDVYLPSSSIGVDDAGAPSGWNELWLDAGGYYGVRGLNPDTWTTLVWGIDPDKAKAISSVTIGGNTGAPFAGVLYFDNMRGYIGSARGMGPNDKLIDGFNDQASIDRLPATPAGDATATPRLTKDATYITEGAGALELDLTGITGWQANLLQPADPTVANIPAVVDLSKASSVLFDIYVPASSHPSWFSFGIHMRGSSGQTFDFTPSVVEGWNTVVAPIPDGLREALKDVNQIWYGVNSGEAWQGPVYIDALRYSEEPAAPAVVKGDATSDGKLGVNDVTVALGFAVGLRQPTPAQLAACDLDGNGSVSIAEVTQILRAAIGIKPL